MTEKSKTRTPQMLGEDVINEYEIRAYGMMRSGNHAIIEWILNQHRGHSTCFFNNLRTGDLDPYIYYNKAKLTGIDAPSDAESLRHRKKHLLLYSHEDNEELEAQPLDFFNCVFDPEFEKSRETYLLKSAHRYTIMIIRDPFNFLASRLKKLDELQGVKNPQWIIKNWKIMARAAIDIEARGDPANFVIKYNRWFTDKEYRRALSHSIGGVFDDTSMISVSRFGGGSSFEKIAPQKITLSFIKANWWKLFTPWRYRNFKRYWNRFTARSARTMGVLERWKLMIRDEAYRELLCDGEILELSETLFGEIPGTRKFMNSLQPSVPAAQAARK